MTQGGATEVPTLGLGTYRVEGDECVENVGLALETGYRHVDTAEAYGNEEAVGEAIASSDVPREEVFLATKVLHPKFTDSYATEDVAESIRACLDRLGVESVELLYGVHWPGGDYEPEPTFEACSQLFEEGAFERLGVCNMTPDQIDAAQAAADQPIDALQVEMHPLLQQEDLRTYCEDNDIDVVAYAPLGNGRVLDVPELEAIADDEGVSVAQVSLAWLREKGVKPIPKATSEDHLRDNWASLELDLTDEEIAKIDNIDRKEQVYDNEYGPTW